MDRENEVKELGGGEVRIKLNKNYWITADSRQFILQTRQVNKEGKESFSSVAFYSNTPNLVKGVLEKEIKTKEASSIEELNNNLNKATEEILDQLDSLKEKR